MPSYEGIVLFNYRITRPLGAGGFGVVFEAVHETLGRRAAIKILHPEFARHEELVARFFREAKAACAVGHRTIVDVTNYGRLETGEPYIMMDLVVGRSLTALVEQDGPLPLERIEPIFAPIASALAAAHAKGVIHRDLKPDNIMVAVEDGLVAEVKLLDFGIAKLVDHSPHSIATRAGSVMGTPNYMAPEQAIDATAIDARADVYSFAATVYAALTGQPPFDAPSTPALLIQVTTKPAPRLRTARPDLPLAVDAWVASCLEKEPSARPATIALAWQQLSVALRRGDVAAPAREMRPRQVVASPHQTTLSAAHGEGRAAAPRRAPSPRARRATLIAAGAVAAAVGVVALRGVGGNDDAQDRSEDAAASALATTVAATSNAPRDAALPPQEPAVVDPSSSPAGVTDAGAAPDVGDRVDPASLDAAAPAAVADDGRGAPAPVTSPPSAPPPGTPQAQDECAVGRLHAASARAVSGAERAQLRRLLDRCVAAGRLSEPARARLERRPAAEPVAPTASPPPPPPPPPPPRPEPVAASTVQPTTAPSGCSKSAFRTVYEDPSTSGAEAQRALERLGACEQQGKISTADARKVRSALTAVMLAR